MSQALYRKWRPRLWDQVVGQDHVVRTLQNAIRGDRVGHAYLFAGPRGTGKTTMARLLAKAVNCLDESLEKRPCDACASCVAVNEGRFLDLIEIDAASNTSVDDVRELRDRINFSPTSGRFKVYIIDEVHMLSTAAFNALLKTLEEPPPHAIFILATTEVHKIPATVLSRCQRHEFRRIPVNHIITHLKNLCEQEKLVVDNDAVVLIARQATGSLRDAISLLDQLASTGQTVTLKTAQEVLGTTTSQLVIDLVESILKRRPSDGLDIIHKGLDSGSDPRQFARQVVEYLRSLLLARIAGVEKVEATPEIRQLMASQATQIELDRLVEAIRLFNTAANDTRGGWQPGLQLELALIETLETSTSGPAAVSTPLPHPVLHRPAQLAPEPHRSTPPPAKLHPGGPHPQTAQSEKQAARPNPPQAKSAQPAFTINDIQQNWSRIRAVVKKQRYQTEGLMNSCKPLAIKDGVLLLGFANELLKSKMENNDNLGIIRQGIATVLGSEIPITCVVSGSKLPTSGPADPDIDGDGIVGTALNMGGQIVQKE